MHDLPDRAAALVEYARNFLVAAIEDVVKQKRGALLGRQAFEHDEKRDREILGSVRFQCSQIVADERLRKPWANVDPTFAALGAQPIAAKVRDSRRQPRLCAAHSSDVCLMPPQIGVLQNILSVGAGPKHAVGDAVQLGPVLLKAGGSMIHGGFPCV
jgi:hypothetical protein